MYGPAGTLMPQRKPKLEERDRNPVSDADQEARLWSVTDPLPAGRPAALPSPCERPSFRFDGEVSWPRARPHLSPRQKRSSPTDSPMQKVSNPECM
jgi:hypothetical protein